MFTLTKMELSALLGIQSRYREISGSLQVLEEQKENLLAEHADLVTEIENRLGLEKDALSDYVIDAESRELSIKPETDEDEIIEEVESIN